MSDQATSEAWVCTKCNSRSDLPYRTKCAGDYGKTHDWKPASAGDQSDTFTCWSCGAVKGVPCAPSCANRRPTGRQHLEADRKLAEETIAEMKAISKEFGLDTPNDGCTCLRPYPSVRRLDPACPRHGQWAACPHTKNRDGSCPHPDCREQAPPDGQSGNPFKVGDRVAMHPDVLVEYRGCTGTVVIAHATETYVRLDQREGEMVWWHHRFLFPYREAKPTPAPAEAPPGHDDAQEAMMGRGESERQLRDPRAAYTQADLEAVCEAINREVDERLAGAAAAPAEALPGDEKGEPSPGSRLWRCEKELAKAKADLAALTDPDGSMLLKLRWMRDTVGVDIERMFARALKEKDGRQT